MYHTVLNIEQRERAWKQNQVKFALSSLPSLSMFKGRTYDSAKLAAVYRDKPLNAFFTHLFYLFLEKCNFVWFFLSLSFQVF